MICIRYQKVTSAGFSKDTFLIPTIMDFSDLVLYPGIDESTEDELLATCDPIFINSNGGDDHISINSIGGDVATAGSKKIADGKKPAP